MNGDSSHHVIPPAASGAPVSRRIVLGVQYDGAPWQGWQTQLNGLTVQDRLEAALQQFTLQTVSTICAGRTDAGVHALEQVVHFDTTLERELSSWVRGVNAFLPSSIAVRWAAEVASATAPAVGHNVDNDAADEVAQDAVPEFHARFSARSRTYQYVLYNNPVRSPLLEGKAGWVFRTLDVDKMREAAQHLLGEHDFSAFRSVQCQARSPVKTMHEIRIGRRGDMIMFTLHANAFLHHMVRNIIGSLVFVGNGTQPPSWLKEVLEKRERKFAAPTFMPDGLYLAKIDYDPKWQLPQTETQNFLWL
jgi:tRNA pseudouridine38-40 synthase